MADPIIPIREFYYDKASKTLVAEISELQDWLMMDCEVHQGKVFTPPSGIVVHGDSADITYVYETCDRNADGDVCGWRYSPTARDATLLSELGRPFVRLLVIND